MSVRIKHDTLLLFIVRSFIIYLTLIREKKISKSRSRHSFINLQGLLRCFNLLKFNHLGVLLNVLLLLLFSSQEQSGARMTPTVMKSWEAQNLKA